MILREAHEGEGIGFRLVHERGELRHFRTQLIRDLAPLLARGLGVVLNTRTSKSLRHELAGHHIGVTVVHRAGSLPRSDCCWLRPFSPSYSAGLEFELTGVAQSVELA